jgi:hypothetical protein
VLLEKSSPLKVLLLRLSIWSMVVRSGAGREVPAWMRSVAMAQYLLSVHTGTDGDAAGVADGGVESGQPSASDQYQQVLALEEDMKAAGAWLFSGRLTDADVATVVRVSATGDAMTTDGPFVESKEHLAGFYIVEADDLDAALGWATRTAAIIGKPIEVRPFFDTKS